MVLRLEGLPDNMQSHAACDAATTTAAAAAAAFTIANAT